MAEVLPMRGQPVSAGGIMSAGPIPPKPAPETVNNSQPIQGLSSHIRKVWEDHKDAKDIIEDRMLASLRQRRGEYDPDKLSQIRSQGGSTIYMMLTSAKCRAASSWFRDVLISQNTEKPWTLDATPVPDLPPDTVSGIYQQTAMEVQEAIQLGLVFSEADVQALLKERKDAAENTLREEADKVVEMMERKMEDQLVEGGFHLALHQFIDDLVTFPVAFVKGPVVRKRKELKWVQGPEGWAMDVQEVLKPEWERVDPFSLYPARHAEGIQDGDLIEFHRLSRSDLLSLIGVEGYNEEAIRKVLEEHGRNGLHEWTSLDTERAQAEGRDSEDHTNPNGLIDALQFWGKVQGELLIEWGLSPEDVPDPLSDYDIEAWLIGNWVIKAMVNPDPLGERPYYAASYEKIPGMLWGNSLPDILRDVQDMCNASARALANNMGIASGPMVWYNMDRMPIGETIGELYPWKVIPFETDQLGSSAAPMGFFQPNSNAQELMAIYEKFASLADEYSGIPRYMTGDANVGGAGRTASGMSMLMTNAGKSMKQVIAHVDSYILVPLLKRLYSHNMRYGEDESIKGDAKVVARGVNALLVKESAQVRRNEFLAATMNPLDMQIIGIEGRAALLRESAKGLDMNPDKVVPRPEELERRALMAAMQAQQEAQMQTQQGVEKEQKEQQGKQDDRQHEMNMAQAKQGGPSQSGQNLQDGAPITDNFSPQAQ